MADGLPPLTGIMVDCGVDGPSQMSIEGPSEASIEGAAPPRTLFGSDSSGNPRGHETPASADAVTEPDPSTEPDVLPQDVPQHVPEGTQTAETEPSTLTHSPQSILSPESVASPKARFLVNFERMENRFDVGADSDGEELPECEDEDFEEPAIKERLVDGSQILPEGEENEPEIAVVALAAVNTEPRHIAIEEEALNKMTVPTLKHELRIREVQFLPLH
jgi:hypothetical protein